MKYKLEITQEQADIISKACDLYCRLRLGQFDRIVDHTLEERLLDGLSVSEYIERKEKMKEHLLGARNVCFDELSKTFQHSYGLGHDTACQIAFNIHQVLRYHAGHDKRLPMAVWGELPEIEKITE